jgi:hypothetical protein
MWFPQCDNSSHANIGINAFMNISYKEFFDSFKDSLGSEGAEELLNKAIVQAHLVRKSEYTKDEAVKICEVLKVHGGFIGIVGGILEARFVVR